MYLYLTPSLFTKTEEDINVSLIRYSIPEMDLILTGNRLSTRQPYPNTNYYTATRHSDNRDIAGFLVKVPKNTDKFSITAEWEILKYGQTRAISQHIDCIVEDFKYDLASQDITFLYARPGYSESRFPGSIPDDVFTKHDQPKYLTFKNCALPCSKADAEILYEGDSWNTGDGKAPNILTLSKIYPDGEIKIEMDKNTGNILSQYQKRTLTTVGSDKYQDIAQQTSRYPKLESALSI